MEELHRLINKRYFKSVFAHLKEIISSKEIPIESININKLTELSEQIGKDLDKVRQFSGKYQYELEIYLEMIQTNINNIIKSLESNDPEQVRNNISYLFLSLKDLSEYSKEDYKTIGVSIGIIVLIFTGISSAIIIPIIRYANKKKKVVKHKSKV